MSISIRVNGENRDVDVDPDTPLLWVLRDILNLTGTKYGCGIAYCGACTVHVNGVPKRACVTPVSSVGTGEVKTIEGLPKSKIGNALLEAWTEIDVAQCGYCQPGQLMSAMALLSKNATPTDTDIDFAMSGNICRCGTYKRIREAINLAASNVKGGDEKSDQGGIE